MKARTKAEVRSELPTLVTVNDNGCWLWNGSLRQNGYGQTWFQPLGRSTKVHKLAAWAWLNGPLVGRPLACHTCDVRRCCNFEHLFLGSHQDNASDAHNKRSVCRNGHPRVADNRIEIHATGYKHNAKHWVCKVCHRLSARRRNERLGKQPRLYRRLAEVTVLG